MNRPTILLVDYDPRSIEATRQPLAAVGYRVELATDGITAVEAFQKLQPDLVLLEMMLPKKHGLDVCRELRRSDPARRTPIVMMGRTSTGTRHRVQALDSGANDFVAKPVPPERLLEICNGLLAAPLGAGEDPSIGADGSERAASTSGARDDGAPDSLEVDLADLSEEEIVARLDKMLPTPPAALAPARSRDSAAPTAREGDRTPQTAPAPEPRPRLAESVQAAAPELLSARPRPADAAATRRPDTAAPTRIEPGSGTEIPPPRPAGSPRRRRARGWAWVAGLAACAALGAVGFLTLEPSPGVPAPELDRPRTPTIGFADAVGEPATTPPGTSTEEAAPGAATESIGGSPIEQALAGEAPPPAPSPVAAAPERGRTQTPPAPPAEGSPPPASAGALEERPGPSVTAPVEESRPPEPAAAAIEPPAMEVAPAEAAEPEPAGEPLLPQAAEESPGPGIVPGALLDLSEVDAPPRPLARPKPRYPPAAMRLRREADVTLRVLVDETGRVAAVEAAGARASADFQAEATRAARRWTYRPATKDGVPVKVWIVEKIVFRL